MMVTVAMVFGSGPVSKNERLRPTKGSEGCEAYPEVVRGAGETWQRGIFGSYGIFFEVHHPQV